MSYRITYGKGPAELRRWAAVAAGLAVLAWCAVGLGPVWQRMAAGEGLYEALARFVGMRILGAQ